ncbi:hypothetical protein [Weissella soli]|uniref:hypothetical protein n=1 Tax=Weissella soli TaxID=155866 RepID=UPI0016454E5E|nr:hypothetical protein [Weissella soli]GJM48726.1 hypothetical protein WSSLDB02_12830 [Weissella soli]
MPFEFENIKDLAGEALERVDPDTVKETASDLLGDKAEVLDNVDLDDVKDKLSDLLD